MTSVDERDQNIINTFVFPIVRRDHILNALRSLKAMTPANYHVIVIDQTRPDAEFERQLRGHCDLWVKTKKNYGFAQASNLGIRLAPTEYVTVVNDDVLFTWPGWWFGIMETFERFDTAVCVNPMSPKEPGWGYGETGFRYHCTFEESLDKHVIQRLIAEKDGAVIDGITCWCTTFRADLLREVGLFDENYTPGGGEDYDFNSRCYRMGYRALATSLSWVWHWWGQSKDEPDGLAQALPAARESWNHVNRLWPDGFDVWAMRPESENDADGNRTWYERIPEIARMGL